MSLTQYVVISSLIIESNHNETRRKKFMSPFFDTINHFEERRENTISIELHTKNFIKNHVKKTRLKLNVEHHTLLYTKMLS